MIRRLSIVLLCLILLLGVASFAVWYWMEGRMQQGFAAWQQSMAAQGWSVQAAGEARGGWPLAADLSLDDFSMTGGADDLPGGASYTAERLTIRLDLLQPTLVTVLCRGRQSVRVGANAALPFTAERFNIAVPIAQGTPPTSAALDAKTVSFAAPAEGLTIGLLQGQADWHAAAAAPHVVGIRLSAEAITLPPPPARQAALGPHIASATIEGTVAGTLPPNPAGPTAAAAGWRDSGGAVDLHHIAVGWGPLGVTGTATFKLDAALQPDASATLRLVGIDETLSALAAGHVITPRAAQTAKAVAGLVVHASEGGGAAGVEVPVTLHDGSVSLGMFPLATVGKLHWPDAP